MTESPNEKHKKCSCVLSNVFIKRMKSSMYITTNDITTAQNKILNEQCDNIKQNTTFYYHETVQHLTMSKQKLS